ncbi:MAG: hypothetical protein HYZ24_10840 [Chloroflexi bacterium]|nr:hypothetical protein [Chloroflexota bacterium]
MRLRLTTWNGVSINNASFYATVPIGVGNGVQAAQPSLLDMGDKPPLMTGKTLQATLYTFHVQLLGTTDAQYESQRDTLTNLFSALDPEYYDLVGEDIDDDDAEWSLTGTTVSSPTIVPEALNLYVITIAVKKPYWAKVESDETTFFVTSDTEDNDVEVAGNLVTQPVITFTPRTAKGSAGIQRFFVAIHPPAFPVGGLRAWQRTPIDLTPSGWDTAAEILAGDMLADGADVQVTVNGIVQPRWFGGGGIDDADTHVWTHLSFPGYPTMSLKTALDATTTPTSIQVQHDDSSLSAFGKTPNRLLAGTEIISYNSCTWEFVPDGASPHRKMLWTFSGLTRGAYNTTKASHSIDDEVHQVANEIWISWGDPDAVAPDEALNEKPAFDLENSTNETWIYDGRFSVEGSDNRLNWSNTPYKNGPGTLYTKEGNDGSSESNDADPWEVIGMKLKSILSGGTVLNDVTSKPAWKVVPSVGYFSVTYEGRYYRSGAEAGILSVGYQGNRGAYVPYSVIDPPVAEDTWEDFSGSFNPPNPYRGVFIVWLTGALGTTLPLPEAMAEINYLELELLYVPVVFIPPTIPASTVYILSGYIRNLENDHRILFRNIQMQIDAVLTIDCVNMTAMLSDGRDARPYLQFDGEIREEWMDMIGGTNTIQFYDADTNNIEIKFVTNGRNTI